jgi:hypothetical protein
MKMTHFRPGKKVGIPDKSGDMATQMAEERTHSLDAGFARGLFFTSHFKSKKEAQEPRCSRQKMRCKLFFSYPCIAVSWATNKP